MRLHHQTLLLAAILSSISFLTTTAQKKDRPPEWKGGSDPVLGEPMRNQIEGTELKLTCSARGSPKPDVMWMKDEEPFFPRTDKIRIKGHNMKFMELKPSDSGNYTCIASNPAGRIDFTFVVHVMEKIWPLETNVSSNQTVFEGESAKFHCIVTNDNTARIQWLRIPQSEIGGVQRHKFLDSINGSPEILILHDVTKDDAGQYTCLVGNEYGSKYHHMYLFVMKPTTTTTSTTSTTSTTTTTTTTTTSTTTTTPTTTTTTTTSTTTTPSTTTTMKPTTTEEPFFEIITIKPKKKNKKKDKKKNKKDKKKDKKKKNKKDRNREESRNNKYDDFYNNNMEIETHSPYDFDNNYGQNIPMDTDRGTEYNINSNTNWYDTNDPGGYEPISPYDNDGYDPYEPNETDGTDDHEKYGKNSHSGNATADNVTGSATGISVWTVYIIVGSVAGGILLAGLVAIAIALCCQKEEDQQYKSTSV